MSMMDIVTLLERAVRALDEARRTGDQTRAEMARIREALGGLASSVPERARQASPLADFLDVVVEARNGGHEVYVAAGDEGGPANEFPLRSFAPGSFGDRPLVGELHGALKREGEIELARLLRLEADRLDPPALASPAPATSQPAPAAPDAGVPEWAGWCLPGRACWMPAVRPGPKHFMVWATVVQVEFPMVRCRREDLRSDATDLVPLHAVLPRHAVGESELERRWPRLHERLHLRHESRAVLVEYVMDLYQGDDRERFYERLLRGLP